MDKLIGPYEFHYCHKCGMYLVAENVGLHDSPICDICMGGRSQESYMKTQERHCALSERRENLIIARKKAGIPMLWWRDPKYKWVFDKKGNVLVKGEYPNVAF